VHCDAANLISTSQEYLEDPTILQLLSFSRYFLSCSFTIPFSGCPTEVIIVKSASIISNVVRAVDSGLVNTSQKKGGRSGDG
jgi:hypothetical protein